MLTRISTAVAIVFLLRISMQQEQSMTIRMTMAEIFGKLKPMVTDCVCHPMQPTISYFAVVVSCGVEKRLFQN